MTVFFRTTTLWPSAPLVSIFVLLSTLFSGILPTTALAQALPTSLALRSPAETLTFSSDDISAWITLSTRPHYTPITLSEIEDIHHCGTLDHSWCDFSVPRSIRSHTTIISSKEINTAALQVFIEQAAKELDIKPVNAILGAENGTVVVKEAEKPGFRVEKDQAIAALSTALLTADNDAFTIDIPGSIITPDIKSSDIERLGITELIAEGTTNFAGSPKNRIFNINRALEQFQGILIAPNEEFSFVKNLGEVDGEHGYLPELVIKNNRTEPEFGGGICQVSSTVFRTAIYAGLKITDRRNHAYPVKYYRPYGMDATIYIPHPDLKFINNTPGSIFLQPFVSGTQLTFQMYGTNDGRQVEIDGPHILESNPDGSMRTIFTQTVNDAQGQNFIRDSFRSNYKSPSLFPHPGDEILKEKPADWPKKQWLEYQRTHAH